MNAIEMMKEAMVEVVNAGILNRSSGRIGLYALAQSG